MVRKYTNNYITTLVTGISSGASSMVATSVALLPVIGGTDYCHLTLQQGGTMEIVKATSNSGTTISITRAQEGTSAAAFTSGATISLRPTAASLNDIQTTLTSLTAGITGYTTTATAAGTTTLTSSDTEQQFFTGTTTQTVVLPVTSTLTLGQTFEIINNSTGVVTVQSSGANTIVAMAAATKLKVTVILTSGTTASSWDYVYMPNASLITGSGKLVRDTNPTLVTPNIGAATGTQLDIDNIRLDGNTLSTTNSNGDVVILPNGTGDLLLGSSTLSRDVDLNFQVAGDGRQGHMLVASYANDAFGPQLSYVKSRSSTIGSFTALQNNDVLLNWNVYGDDGVITRTAVQIVADVTGAVSSGIIPTRLRFRTTTTGGTLTTALTIDNTQVVTLAQPLPVTSGGTGVTTATGSGNAVLSTSPTLVTPILGTPTSGTLTSCTGLPVATGISGLGTGVATALAVATNASGGIALETDGTFTPVLKFGGATTGITYSVQSGLYSRTGNIVTFTVYLNVSSKGSATGAATITGMPVSSRNAGAGQIMGASLSSLVNTTGRGQVIGYINANSTTLVLTTANLTGGGDTAIDDASCNASGYIYVSGTYLV